MRVKVMLRRSAVALTATALLATPAAAPAGADTGTLTATCQIGGAPHPPPPATGTYSWTVTVPPTVAPGEHFEATVSVGYGVDVGSDLGIAVVGVAGATPDVPFPGPGSTAVVSAPGSSSLSGTVGLTADSTPGTSVRLGIRSFGQQTTVGSAVVTHSCQVPSTVHARTYVSGPGPAPDPTVSIGDASISEGTSGPARTLTVPITLSSPSTTPVSVVVSVVGGSASPGVAPSGDYKTQPPTRTVRFLPTRSGLTPLVKNVSIPITPDATTEGNETIELGLSDVVGPYGLRDDRGVVTIIDDEGLTGPAGAVGDIATTEGTSGTRRVSIPVTLNQPVGETVVARVDVFGSSASCAVFSGATPPSGIDCRARRTSVTVKFLAGQVSKLVGQQVFADGTVEFDEIVGVSLQSIGPENTLSSTIVGRSRVLGSVTLVDDD